MQGTVIFFSDKRGYGFIQPDDPKVNGGKDLFCHWKNIKMEGFKKLEAGNIVEFELGTNDKGAQAVDIIILSQQTSA